MSLFIGGTGTEVGKTFVTAALLLQLGPPWRARKPVASGAPAEDPCSDPALLARLQDCAVPEVCLHRFAAPVAPDQAARQEGREIDWPGLVAFCQEDHQLIEGAGGLYSPLTSTRTNADLARALGCPVLLVAGTKLGTISATLATARAAAADGICIAGIVLSQQKNDPPPPPVIESLRRLRPDLPPILALPYRSGEEPWREAPDMTRWLNAHGLGEFRAAR